MAPVVQAPEQAAPAVVPVRRVGQAPGHQRLPLRSHTEPLAQSNSCFVTVSEDSSICVQLRLGQLLLSCTAARFFTAYPS